MPSAGATGHQQIRAVTRSECRTSIPRGAASSAPASPRDGRAARSRRPVLNQTPTCNRRMISVNPPKRRSRLPRTAARPAARAAGRAPEKVQERPTARAPPSARPGRQAERDRRSQQEAIAAGRPVRHAAVTHHAQALDRPREARAHHRVREARRPVQQQRRAEKASAGPSTPAMLTMRATPRACRRARSRRGGRAGRARSPGSRPSPAPPARSRPRRERRHEQRPARRVLRERPPLVAEHPVVLEHRRASGIGAYARPCP